MLKLELTIRVCPRLVITVTYEYRQREVSNKLFVLINNDVNGAGVIKIYWKKIFTENLYRISLFLKSLEVSFTE